MAYKLQLKRGINIGRVVSKIATTVLVLYVGGTLITEIGEVMNCTANPFNDGLSIIGWTITDSLTVDATNASIGACSGTSLATGTYDNVITQVGGTGLLAVVGIVGLASIVMEFVHFRMG